MAKASEEGLSPKWAVVPLMMMMMEVISSPHFPAALSPAERSLYSLQGSWRDIRSGLGALENYLLFLPDIDPRFVGRSALMPTELLPQTPN